MPRGPDPQPEAALAWLAGLLQRHGVPYQVVGGLAAQAYGATRPLVDIDLYMPFDRAAAALEEMQPYMVRDALPHRSAAWDLVYLALDVQGVYIEIGDSSSNPRFFNRLDQRWEPQVIDYAASCPAMLYGVELAVMPREELARYKAMLDREVDHLDLQQMATAAAFATFPTLITPRLVLRAFAPGDAADLFAFRSDPEVQKYDSDPPLRDLAEAEKVLQWITDDYAAKKALQWAVTLKEEGRVIGHLAFFFEPGRWYNADLGYILARPYWRRGIASEAVRALLAFGFETLRLHRVNVDTRMDNLASLGLMRALGFQHEGARRECIRNEDGTYQTWGLFGMLAEEYCTR